MKVYFVIREGAIHEQCFSTREKAEAWIQREKEVGWGTGWGSPGEFTIEEREW